MTNVKIIENEIDPINIGLQTTFGDEHEFSLISVRLAIGSNEHDYVTIDESDLFTMDVELTMNGLLNFIEFLLLIATVFRKR